MSDTPDTPDAPPGDAAGPRPGERYMNRNSEVEFWNVWEVAFVDGERCDRIVGLRLTEADARLLVGGQRAVDELEKWLAYSDGHPESDFGGHLFWRRKHTRDALAAVRPAG